MIRNFNTVVLERLKYFDQGFATEPYEVGWASEAIFFIRVHEIEGTGVRMGAMVQISVDGIEWVDEGTSFEAITDVGNYFVKAAHFGGWLRLKTNIEGENAELKLTVQLVLKE